MNNIRKFKSEEFHKMRKNSEFSEKIQVNGNSNF